MNEPKKWEEGKERKKKKGGVVRIDSEVMRSL